MFQKKDVFDLSPKCTTPQLQLLMMNHTVTENFRFYRNISAGLQYFLPNIALSTGVTSFSPLTFWPKMIGKKYRPKRFGQPTENFRPTTV
jgi:hypothetical protein